MQDGQQLPQLRDDDDESEVADEGAANVHTCSGMKHAIDVRSWPPAVLPQRIIKAERQRQKAEQQAAAKPAAAIATAAAAAMTQ